MFRMAALSVHERYLNDVDHLETVLSQDRTRILFVDVLFTAHFIADTRLPEDMIEQGLELVTDYLEQADDVKSKRIIRGMLPAVNRANLSPELRSRILVTIACN